MFTLFIRHTHELKSIWCKCVRFSQNANFHMLHSQSAVITMRLSYVISIHFILLLTKYNSKCAIPIHFSSEALWHPQFSRWTRILTLMSPNAFPGYLESTFKWGPCVHDTELKPGTPSTRMVRITQKQGSVKHERGVHCRTPTRGHHSTIVAVFLLCRHKLFVVLFSYTDPRVIKCCPTQHHLRG